VAVSASGPVRWNEPYFTLFARGRDGEVARGLVRDAIRVMNQAKRNATGGPVSGARNPEGRGPRVRTGRLRSSITFALGTDSRGVFCDVGTNVVYAKPLERGLRGGRTYPFLSPALDVLQRP
jgi:hypothetical protein